MTAPDRTAFAEGLRQLADLLEHDPAIPLPYTGTGAGISFHFAGAADEQSAMDDAARRLGASWQPDHMYGDDAVYVSREGWLAGLRLSLIRRAAPGDGPR